MTTLVSKSLRLLNNRSRRKIILGSSINLDSLTNKANAATPNNNANSNKQKINNAITKGMNQGKRFITWGVSLGLVTLGSLLTIVVGMGLYSELFKSSIWEVFNQSLELIQENNRVQKIFGNDVTGHADPRSRRRRDRKPDYQLFTDKEQKKNMIMKYYIEGEKDSHGVVYVHCIENKAKDGWDYKLLTVEVPGQYFSSKITIKNDSNKLGASW